VNLTRGRERRRNRGRRDCDISRGCERVLTLGGGKDGEREGEDARPSSMLYTTPLPVVFLAMSGRNLDQSLGSLQNRIRRLLPVL
jgi:hypothetical protein